jgi:hypothetical protein
MSYLNGLTARKDLAMIIQYNLSYLIPPGPDPDYKLREFNM